MSSNHQLFGELRSFIAANPRPDERAIKALLHLLHTAAQDSPEAYDASWIPYLEGIVRPPEWTLPLLEVKDPRILANHVRLLPFPVWEFKGMWLSGAKTLDALEHGFGEYLYSLRLQECNLNDAKLEMVLSHPSLTHLQRITICGLQNHVLTRQHMRTLAMSPSARTLHTLRFDYPVVTLDALEELCACAEFTSLRRLEMDMLELTPAALTLIACSRFAPQLEHLSLSSFQARDEDGDLEALSSPMDWRGAMTDLPRLRALTHLTLVEVGMTRQGLEELASQSPWLEQLDVLELYYSANPFPSREEMSDFLERAALSATARAHITQSME